VRRIRRKGSLRTAAGLLDPQAVGRPLPFVDRVELYLEKEPTSAFNKFLQGYYDQSRIIEERFDQIVPDGNLSPEMAALGVRLTKSIVPGVYYLGFNMDDRVVGSPNGQRGRLLRQAISLAIDAREFIRIFMNNRGIVAETPIPPGLFGHDAALPNPFREPDLEKANELLRQAGYPGGIDPETGKPLRLTFDTADTTARGLLRYQFFVDAWRRLGLDVQIAATNYNQFQDKVRRGAYQIFFWGWIADYPDPENFLALLWGPLGKSKSGGENTANFASPEYDRLFVAMRDLPDGPERTDLIRRMVEIVEVERPWIELFYPEDYELSHGWLENVKPLGMSFSTLKYKDVDPLRRAELRQAWNEPILWPAYALAALVVAAVVPGVATYLRERQ
jgi:ABC-type transport system substrate-binding protein